MRKNNAHSQAENRLAYAKWVLSSKEAHGKIFLSFIIRYIASQRKKLQGAGLTGRRAKDRSRFVAPTVTYSDTVLTQVIPGTKK